MQRIVETRSVNLQMVGVIVVESSDTREKRTGDEASKNKIKQMAVLPDIEAQKRDMALVYILTPIDRTCKGMVQAIHCPEKA